MRASVCMLFALFSLSGDFLGNRAICLHLTMLSAKVVNISETPKKWEDFLIRRPLPYPADIKNGYIYSLVLGVYVTTLCEV